MWQRFIALDPGEVHNGIALFNDAQCEWAREMTPTLLFDFLTKVTEIDGIVIEEFRLYPWLAKQQSFSQLKTVEVIGTVKFICKNRSIPLIEQSAKIKIPTDAQVKARTVQLKSAGKGGHAKDAELHGYYHLWKQGVVSAKHVLSKRGKEK